MSCAVAPAYKDVRIILKDNGSKIYELNAVGVNDVRYIKKSSGIEVLEIEMPEKSLIQIIVDPEIEINHFYNSFP